MLMFDGLPPLACDKMLTFDCLLPLLLIKYDVWLPHPPVSDKILMFDSLLPLFLIKCWCLTVSHPRPPYGLAGRFTSPQRAASTIASKYSDILKTRNLIFWKPETSESYFSNMFKRWGFILWYDEVLDANPQTINPYSWKPFKKTTNPQTINP